MQPIYLDNNATTMMLPEVADAILECYRAQVANPASMHAAGRRARRMLEESREAIVAMLGGSTAGMQSDRLVFTSGGTESNNLALRGLTGDRSSGKAIIVSAIEHPSVMMVARQLAQAGRCVRYLSVDARGVVRLDELDEWLQGEAQLVSVMVGNHETGVLQPVAEVAGRCRERDVLTHTDAVQAVGKIQIDFRRLGVDAMSFSAHKFHGPVGIGGLLMRHGLTPLPMLHGGFQQSGIRPGTESVCLAVGMKCALDVAMKKQDVWLADVACRRDRLAAALRRVCPQIVIHGESARRLPHVLNAAFPGTDQQALVMALDLAGVACSTGSACASGSSEPSPVLTAMGVSPELIRASIRLSLSGLTTDLEIDDAARRISKVINNLQRRNQA